MVSPDLELIVAGIKLATRVPESLPLQSIISRRVLPPADGEPGAPTSDEEWSAFARQTTVTDWHPVGTCAMLPEKAGGVVDARLRVYGVKGLRVVDASIIPTHISSHLQATVFAIGEKGAALVQEDYAGITTQRRNV